MEFSDNHHLMIVSSNPVAGREQEYHEWYDHHLVESIERFPGFESGRRYELAPGQTEAGFRFLAVYRVAPGELQPAREAIDAIRRDREAAALQGREASMPRSSAMAQPHFGWFYSPISELVRRTNS